MAFPEASVVAVPPTPVLGPLVTANVTVTPDTPLPLKSLTVAVTVAGTLVHTVCVGGARVMSDAGSVHGRLSGLKGWGLYTPSPA